MLYLIVCILFSSAIYVCFKLFKTYNVNTFQAIVCNYFSAIALGIISSPTPVEPTKIFAANWLWGAVILGVLFVLMFYVLGRTSQKNGMSVASVASKMSVVIPVTFGIVVYNESAGFLKLIGIVLALVAVYLTSVKTKGSLRINDFIFPTLLFFGSGVIDTSLKYFENHYVADTMIPIFSATIFFFAAVFGIVFLAIKGNLNIGIKEIIGGLILGIPNYYSIAFLMQALSTNGLESSTVFTINHVSIVALTTLIGLFFFKEKMLLKNWIGVTLAIISIVFVIS